MTPFALPQLPSLKNKHIVLGVCGGIAAYKAAELVRLLCKQGCSVQVVMTPAATEFVGPLTYQALSGKPVYISQWPEGQTDRGMPHIDISRACDFLLIAPCTANSLGKYAQGLANNLLDNLVLARNCPMAIAPAMNVEMWNNAATQRNLKQLRQDGIHIFGPASGEQACGEVGQGRMLEPWQIVFELARTLSPQPFQNKRVLITAGPTFEAIDPVRGITNRSSGKMGYAIAQAAWLLGADVKLISGPTALPAPYGTTHHAVMSAKAMHQQVMQHLPTAQIFIGVAAVADYGIKNPSEHKQKKGDSAHTGLHMEFELNPDILADVGQYAHTHPSQGLTVVGFAAETQHLDEYAQKKLIQKKAHYMVGNLAQHSLNTDETELTLYSHRSQPTPLPKTDKLSAALSLLQHLQP